jgi:hypothetical protein
VSEQGNRIVGDQILGCKRRRRQAGWWREEKREEEPVIWGDKVLVTAASGAFQQLLGSLVSPRIHLCWFSRQEPDI